MLASARLPLVFVTLLVALLTLPTIPAMGQAFQAVILPEADGDDHAEATGISRDGIVAGYGWAEDESSPRRGLRWTPAYNYGTVEAPQMDGNLASVVFHGIDPISEWPFGAAVGPDTAGAIHAIQVDEIVPDPNLPDLHYGRWTDTHGAGFSESQMLGGVQAYRVGLAVPVSGYLPHALLWETATWTSIDLHPSGYTYSTAAAVASANTAEGPYTRIAGWAEQQGRERAIEWGFFFINGFITPVDRHPNGYDSSRAHGVSSRWIVGAGSPASTGTQHALSFGSAGNAIDLNPSWASYSQALGASESGIVGYSGSSLSGRRALYWSAPDPNVVVDLHQFLPTDYISSHAVALNDAKQIVGAAINASGDHHAVLWRPVRRFWTIFPRALAGFAQIVDAHVVLEKPAPKGGLRIRLSPTAPEKTYAWALQEEILIPEGKTSAVFDVATTERRASRPVRATITATWGKEFRQATLTIDPSR